MYVVIFWKNLGTLMNHLKTFYNHAAYLETGQLTCFSEQLTTFNMDSKNVENMKLTVCSVNKN